jgi:hypothetical protein
MSRMLMTYRKQHMLCLIGTARVRLRGTSQLRLWSNWGSRQCVRPCYRISSEGADACSSAGWAPGLLHTFTGRPGHVGELGSLAASGPASLLPGHHMQALWQFTGSCSAPTCLDTLLCCC